MPRGARKQAWMLRNARSQRVGIHVIEKRIRLSDMPGLLKIRARTRGRRRT